MALRTSTQDGPWATDATWGGSAAPVAGDSASIGHNVTLSLADVLNFGTVTMTGTGHLTIVGKRLHCQTVTIPVGTTVTVSEGANLDRNGDFNIIVEGTLHGNGTPTAPCKIGDTGGNGLSEITGDGTLTATYTSFVGLSTTTRFVGKAWWEWFMVVWGETHAQRMIDFIGDEDIGSILTNGYYDQGKAMYQIADYTGNSEPWSTYAANQLDAYRTMYITPNGGSVPSFWGFTEGLRMRFERTGLVAAKTAMNSISDFASYHQSFESDLGPTRAFCRENAYCIIDFKNEEDLGGTLNPRYYDCIEWAYGHLEFWVADGWVGQAEQVSPFMMAIVARSLIKDWELTGDSRLLPLLEELCDYMWDNAFYSATSSLLYQINPLDPETGGVSLVGAPDLNMIIAPVYAWVYSQTGSTTQRDRYDILEEGIKYADLETNGKQWNQNFWWSFDGVYWRYDITPPEPPPTPDESPRGNLGRGW